MLAVDAGHQVSSFVQRLERSDVECELVPTEAAAIAAADADVVLVEAEALDCVAARGTRRLGGAGGRGRHRRHAGVGRRRLSAGGCRAR